MKKKIETQKKDEKTKKTAKLNKKISTINQSSSKFKEQYFAFYDDIKDYTRGKEDWWLNLLHKRHFDVVSTLFQNFSCLFCFYWYNISANIRKH